MDSVDRSGLDITTDKPVMVTGATGYVAGWIVKALLEAGVTVHATVRDPSNEKKTRHLQEMADENPGEIKFFAADLLNDGAFLEAMEGCHLVFHTASPFISTVEDPQRDLIDPAQLGTRNVLNSVNETESVERVVLTSSCAAIYTDALDCENAPNGRITEEIWNTTARLDYQPYNLSKTLAERAAWDLADKQDRWSLVTINPSLVIGPATNPRPTSESFNIVTMIGDGTFRFGAPRVGLGVVDVREVARAHIAAGYIPEAAGRYIVSGHNTTVFDMATSLLGEYGDDYPLPTRPLPKALMWLVAPFVDLDRPFIARNVNHRWDADTSKGRRELGLVYRPMGESMNEMFAVMIEQGTFTK